MQRSAAIGSRAGFALEPAAVLPAQIATTFRLGANLQPEKRLMLAVLEDAVADYLREATCPPGTASATFVAASAWLQSSEASWPFSLTAICRALGLEPSAIRRGLRIWRHRELALPPEQRTRGRSPFRRMNGTRTKTRSPALGLKVVHRRTAAGGARRTPPRRGRPAP